MGWNPLGWDFSTDADRTNQERAEDAIGQGGAARQFADVGEKMFQGDTANVNNALGQQRGFLQDLQSGKNSVSAEQLRQGLQQNLASQRSLAAGASPANQAMAARNAAMNMGQMGYGLAGQQAVAGLQERNQATMAMNELNQQLLGQRGQDLQAALGSRGNAINAYNGPQQQQSAATQMAMGALGGFAAALSDRRAKTDIKPGDDAAERALDRLRAFTYSYKDPSAPGARRGTQLGVMAQDLEKAVPSAVSTGPDGMKRLDAGKLAGANTAMLVALNQRVKALEAGDDGDQGDDGDDDAAPASRTAPSGKRLLIAIGEAVQRKRAGAGR